MGARYEGRVVQAQLGPEIFWQQNKDYRFIPSNRAGYSEYANRFRGDIDLPTRFGPESFSTVHLGQTFVQVKHGKFAAAVSTENIWVGAAEVYPILHSYTAPGFPHVRIGTTDPLDLKVATVELQLVMASLKSSEYFEAPSDRPEHYYTVLFLALQPHILPGLHLGLARAYHDTASAFGQSPGFYAERIIERSIFGNRGTGNRTTGNGIGVVFGRWALPESRFEVYGEWSREDTPAGWEDLLREPDWTQAYVLGFQKALGGDNRLVRLYGELIHLGESAPARSGRGFFSYYTHSQVKQGHTHKGQLLGAAIGPGSDAQLLGVDVFTERGRNSLRVERTRYDEDTYYRRFARRYGEARHDAEITVSAARTHFTGPFQIHAGVQYSRRYGRDFLPLEIEGPDLIENNWSTRLSAAWNPTF